MRLLLPCLLLAGLSTKELCLTGVAQMLGQTLIPYVRGTLYEGGKKFETNAPRYDVRELEMGVEWQILKALEVTGAYMVSDRTSSRYPYTQQRGDVTRIQVQVNY